MSKEDNVLIIDDFLAKGSALTALLMLIEKAGAKTAGAGIVSKKLIRAAATSFVIWA